MRRNLLRAEWAGLACAWPVAAWAYTRAEAFGAELAAIPLEALGYAALLALLGGLASTLRKIANPDAPLRSVGLEVAKDLSTSLVAGLMCSPRARG